MADRPVVGVGVVLTRPDDTVALGPRVTAGEPPTWCLPGGWSIHPLAPDPHEEPCP